MNWVSFTIVTWLFLGLELGLRDALRLGDSSIGPSFVIPLLVYVTLSTPPRTATWAAAFLGVLLDLSWLLVRGSGPAGYVIGPYALGMIVSAQLVHAARGLVIRNHPIAIAVLAGLAAMVTHIVVVALLTLRGAGIDDLDFSPTGQLQARLFSSIYTGAVALVLSFIFRQIEPVMGFHLDRYGRHVR
ncbi:MAG: hypothetical protein CMJ31_10595 [Phycisphaerae bacterium]|nr:hypothetical protein [Phycisphaerae bacterium]